MWGTGRLGDFPCRHVVVMFVVGGVSLQVLSNTPPKGSNFELAWDLASAQITVSASFTLMYNLNHRPGAVHGFGGDGGLAVDVSRGLRSSRAQA